MQAPDIWAHTDFRRYLEAWFAWRKGNNSRFSHRAVAKKLGTTDPSLLVNILKGRRKLPERLVPEFCRLLALEGDEAECFCVLVHIGQADDERERERAWADMATLRGRLRKPEVDADRVKYYSSVSNAVIRSLVLCREFRADPAWIGSRLDPPISPEAAAEALALLLRLGFLRQEGDRFVLTEPVVRTPQFVENLGTWEFHAQNIDRARTVLEEVRLGGPAAYETLYLGVTAAIPVERFAELQSMLYDHMRQILSQVTVWEQADRVYQLNLQLVPMTRTTTG